MSGAVAQQPAQKRLLIPKTPVLVMAGHSLYCLTLDGELKQLDEGEARAVISRHMPIVCNGATNAPCGVRSKR